MSVYNQNKPIHVIVQNFCPCCGTKLSSDSKFCMNCGILISSDENKVKEYITRQKESTVEKLKLILLATAFIWLSVITTSIFAPDLVSGSQQEHLPLVSWTMWLWGLIANVFVMRLYREQTEMNILRFQVIGIIGLWVIVSLVSVFAPPLVTGSDPTRLPIVSLVAPLIGCILTSGIWFLGKPANNY